jgi:hypothetical protein
VFSIQRVWDWIIGNNIDNASTAKEYVSVMTTVHLKTAGRASCVLNILQAMGSDFHCFNIMSRHCWGPKDNSDHTVAGVVSTLHMMNVTFLYGISEQTWQS